MVCNINYLLKCWHYGLYKESLDLLLTAPLVVTMTLWSWFHLFVLLFLWWGFVVYLFRFV